MGGVYVTYVDGVDKGIWNGVTLAHVAKLYNNTHHVLWYWKLREIVKLFALFCSVTSLHIY